MEEKIENNFRQGFKDGLPIGLGYLSVSFTFGMIAIAGGMPIEVAVLISLTNMTSAGQFAGLTLMFANGSLIEMALTQLVINIRYALMSLSLSQKLAKRVTTPKRCLIAFANTDEIFAVASSKTGKIGEYYMYGLAILPIIGWTSGTFLGAAINSLLPAAFQSAFGIAIYGMFIAIVVPPAKHS
ncbi:MAG: AzlC family ABC transporter permease, partial [Erysipelotrichaceae bacterium]